MKKRGTVLVSLGALAVLSFLFLPEGKLLSELRGNGFEEGTILFVGDIMLGRSVERIMDREGMQYPFVGVSDFLFSPDVTVGNFEASVPLVHVPTPNFSFAFSVREEYLGVLKEEGFDALSLANNHALDYGEAGFTHTRTVCEEMGLQCFGHPTQSDTYATTIVSVGDTRIGLFGLHTLFVAPDMNAITKALLELETKSDMQIAYIHWGDEYEPFHNDVQESLAHSLIDHGVDAVIGHHPHVVQDIEIYDGKPIFYSLGNFIFDQYWSEETQKGMAVELFVEEEFVTYTPVPITSLGTKSQPHLVEEKDADALVESLFNRSHGLESYREGTKIRIPR